MPRNNRGWALPLKKFKDKFLYINSKDFSQISILKTKIYLYLQYLQSASTLILDQSNSLNCRPWTVEHSNPVSHPLYWLPVSKEYSLKPFLAYMALPLNQNFIRLQPSCYRPWRQTWATYVTGSGKSGLKSPMIEQQKLAEMLFRWKIFNFPFLAYIIK